MMKIYGRPLFAAFNVQSVVEQGGHLFAAPCVNPPPLLNLPYQTLALVDAALYFYAIT